VIPGRPPPVPAPDGAPDDPYPALRRPPMHATTWFRERFLGFHEIWENLPGRPLKSIRAALYCLPRYG